MIFNDNSYLDKLTQLVRWGHWYCLTNIVLAGLLSTLYIVADPYPGTLIGAIYLLLNWLGHTAFICFFIFIITIFPFCFLYPNSHFLRGLGTVVASIGCSLLLLDIGIYFEYGLHLQTAAADVLLDEAQHTFSNLQTKHWIYLFTSFVLMLGLQLALSNFVWRRLDKLENNKFGVISARILVASFISSHLLHIWADATLYQPIVRQDNMFPLSYPATAKTLMAKHGFIDEETLFQRKKLKLNIRNKVLRVHEGQLNCENPAIAKVTLVLVNDLTLADLSDNKWQNLASKPGVHLHQRHIDTGSSIGSSLFNVLHGLPEVYRAAAIEHSSLSEKLVKGLDSKLLVYPGNVESLMYFVNQGNSSTIPVNWQGQNDSFISHFNDMPNGITLAIVDKNYPIEQLIETSDFFILTGLNSNKAVPLFNNINTIAANQVTGHTDLFNSLYQSVYQCQGNTELLSLGQNMFEPTRPWLVNSYGGDIYFYQQDLVIQLSRNGSYKAKNIYTGEQVKHTLDMALLTRATNYLQQLFQ